MIGDLFDSPWKVLILAAVILVMFGSKKLPDAARSLGKSMRILKTEIHDLHEEDAAPGTVPAGAGATVPTPAQITQQQAESLQQQLDELRRQPQGADARQAG